MVAEIWALVISPFVDQWVALNNYSALDSMLSYNYIYKITPSKQNIHKSDNLG